MRAIIRTPSAIVLGLALFLSGCGNLSSDSNRELEAGSADQVTIRMMHLWPEESASAQYHLANQIINEYQAENPNVIIKLDALENEQYKARLKVLSAVNDLPDVGMTWAAGYLQPFVEGKLFTPLNDLLHHDLQDAFVAGTTEAYTVGGHLYALPLEFNIAPIFYNKQIFARYNLEVPATYDEFLHVVETLADHGIVPIALGNKDRWTGSLWYMYLADRIAGTATLENAIQGFSSFTDPGLVEAAGRIQDLVDRNAFNKGFNGLSNEEAKSVFIHNQAAMFLMGTWDLPNYTTNADVPQAFRDSVGFFKFPTVPGGKSHIDSWVGGPGVGLFVAEHSPVKAEAKKFVEYFVKRWGEESVTGVGVIPATKVNTANIQLPPLYIDLLNEVNKAANFTLFADVQMASGAAEVHLNQIQALFGKEITPEAFALAHDAASRASREVQP